MNPVRSSEMKFSKNKTSNGVKIIIKNLQKRTPVNPTRIKKAALNVLSHAGRRNRWMNKSGEITICFLNDSQIRELNLFYLGDGRATDVIAFNSLGQAGELIADIAVSTDTARRNARIFKTTVASETYRYVIHGLLHILGYNDDNKRNSAIMRKKEDYLLTLFSKP